MKKKIDIVTQVTCLITPLAQIIVTYSSISNEEDLLERLKEEDCILFDYKSKLYCYSPDLKTIIEIIIPNHPYNRKNILRTIKIEYKQQHAFLITIDSKETCMSYFLIYLSKSKVFIHLPSIALNYIHWKVFVMENLVCFYHENGLNYLNMENPFDWKKFDDYKSILVGLLILRGIIPIEIEDI